MKRILTAFMVLSLNASAVLAGQEGITSGLPDVRIHYIGHASFLLTFDNGLTVLTDYGESDSYGLNSPIRDLEGLMPDIVTFSHAHPDHMRPGMEFRDSIVLTGSDSLDIDGLRITPIRTSERSLEADDNTSFLFTYKGLKILHLADAQAYITAIDSAAVRRRVLELYPERYDLLLMTIQGVTEFIPQAEAFIDLLRPSRVIPMHYWSPGYKADFLALIEEKDADEGRHYMIEYRNGPECIIYTEEEVEPVAVISLEPADAMPGAGRGEEALDE